MDYLDSLDLETTNRKSDRMRSWYLYEQFKALESNQLEAAQKLRNRSYQERILRRELFERKARRNFYDKFGLCYSECKIDHCIKGKASLAASVGNDFIDNFDGYKNKYILKHERETSEEEFSQDESIPEKSCIEEYLGNDDLKNDNSYPESVNSVMEHVASNETICERRSEEFKLTRKDMSADISKQLDVVQENLELLENITKMPIDKCSELASLNSVEKCDSKKKSVEEMHLNVDDVDSVNNVVMMWSRLVSFAYQVIQLNRGNCYYDYSSQLLTAVLACDVLRRGVNQMCHILQPYVSPIKFEEWDECGVSCKKVKRKKSVRSKKSKNTFDYTLYPRKQKNVRLRDSFRKYSDECWCWQDYDKYSYENLLRNKKRYASEPQRSLSKHILNDISSECSSNSLWPVETSCSKEIRHCCSHKNVVNPMLKIARYIDSILQHVDESKRV